MAKTPASTLIADLAKRLDLDSSDATVRADMLRQLNISKTAILQDYSLRFLEDFSTVTLSSAASSAAVPTTIDDGKTLVLGRVAGDGEIEYEPIDGWFRTHLDTYREPTQTGPSYYTIVQVAGVRTFLFKPGNTSGVSMAIPIAAQLIPVALTDSGSSLAELPEGWEDTLLLDHAEVELLRFADEMPPDYLVARVADKQERLYSSYRTTKEQATTDREQVEMKNAREKLGPEKP